MRALILAGLFAVTATPAAAQRLDTRRDEIENDAGAVSCRFHAYPEMTLLYQADGAGQAAALW